MSIAIPKDVRDRIQQKIWTKADELGWSRISDVERANWYENWSKDKDVGGTLGHFMDPRKIRVYIKDSLLKPYQCARLRNDLDKVLRSLRLEKESLEFVKTFSKPHGRLLCDGRVICWGNSRDWKSILFSVFERSYYTPPATPYAAALIETGNTKDDAVRQMIIDASRRLGLNELVWVE